MPIVDYGDHFIIITISRNNIHYVLVINADIRHSSKMKHFGINKNILILRLQLQDLLNEKKK